MGSNNRMFDLNLTKIFVTVFETKSITKSADILKIPKATISRKIAYLEENLGVKLIHRTTRKLQVTKEGQQYYQRCNTALKTIDEANQKIIALQNENSGEIKLSCPVLFADQFLGKLIFKFQKQYPNIGFRINSTNEFIDLVKENVDVAFRCANNSASIDSNYIARNLGKASYCVVASPNYIDKFGEIEHPNDVHRHKTIGHSTQWNSSLHFSRNEELISITPMSILNVDSINMMTECAIEGMGITILPCYSAMDALESGKLKILLFDWEFIFGDIHLIYPSAKFIPKKVRLFIDFSLDYFRSVIPWESSKNQMKKYIYQESFVKKKNIVELI